MEACEATSITWGFGPIGAWTWALFAQLEDRSVDRAGAMQPVRHRGMWGLLSLLSPRCMMQQWLPDWLVGDGRGAAVMQAGDQAVVLR